MIDLRNTGLSVVYDGAKYNILFDERNIGCEVGSLMCEFMRFSPEEFKVILMMCPYFDNKITDMYDDEQVTLTLKWVYDQLYYKYPPVIVEIVYAMLAHDVDTYTHTTAELREMLLREMIRTNEEKKLLNSIFKGTKYAGFDDDYIGQALLFAYYNNHTTYMLFKTYFKNILDASGDSGTSNDFPVASFDSLFINQDIGFKILNMDGRLSSLYKIKDAMSLLAFETANISKRSTRFVKCRNCGHYFVPATRSDTVYCNYLSPQKAGKTCKEVGAQITRAKKEKTDEATRLYRKIYMKYKMRCKRHPEDLNLQSEYIRFTDEGKEMRRLLDDKEITEEFFFKWIKRYEE